MNPETNIILKTLALLSCLNCLLRKSSSNMCQPSHQRRALHIQKDTREACILVVNLEFTGKISNNTRYKYNLKGGDEQSNMLTKQ